MTAIDTAYGGWGVPIKLPLSICCGMVRGIGSLSDLHPDPHSYSRLVWDRGRTCRSFIAGQLIILVGAPRARRIDRGASIVGR